MRSTIDLSKMTLFRYAGNNFYINSVRAKGVIDIRETRVYDVDTRTISNNFASADEVAGTKRTKILEEFRLVVDLPSMIRGRNL